MSVYISILFSPYFLFLIIFIYFDPAADEESIPTKPSKGCPRGTKPSGDDDKDCCCEGLENCCWHKCPLEGTLENLKKLTSCGIEGGQDKWSYANLTRNGNERAFVAQGGSN